MHSLALRPQALKATRLFSTTPQLYHPRPTPRKDHLHQPIPDSHFPLGYITTSTHCGIKKKPGVLDLGVLISTSPQTSAAACFTRNAFQAAPVLVSTEVLKQSEGRVRALVVNSGCANAVTGAQGLKHAWAMAAATDNLARELTESGGGYETVVMSTGVIGQHLPIQKITDALASEKVKSGMGLSFGHWEGLARAFMTTDTFPKLRARKFELMGKEIKFAGIDKGAGMIHPNMGPPALPHATLLGVIATDAPVTPRSLQSALTYAVDRSFNSISVDGDMSTNDTVIAFANGAAFGEDAPEIDQETHPAEYTQFRDHLTSFATELASLVGAPTYADAHRVASTISTSALVKTALYGEDANWGRILCAVGYTALPSGTPINPSSVSVSFVPADKTSPLALLTNGEPEPPNEERASEILKAEDLEIRVQLGLGNESAKYYTCDFSHEYVTINGDYRS
ncbi:glutamate N-acetyltransferase [Ceratobasidium sp. AG-Ba]|nr:glutamate N-acetyltransferase [Ceratobasidium sp. AG-Ba]